MSSSVTLSMNTDRGDHRPRLTTFVGATARLLTLTISGEDLTDKTLTLTARAGGVDGTVVLDGRALTVTDAAGGVCTFNDGLGTLDTAGELDAQVTIVDAGFDVDYSEPFVLVVLPVIAGSS